MVMRVFQTRPIICCFLSRYPFVSSFLLVARCTLDPFLQASVGRFIFTFSPFQLFLSYLSFVALAMYHLFHIKLASSSLLETESGHG